MLVYTS